MLVEKSIGRSVHITFHPDFLLNRFLVMLQSTASLVLPLSKKVRARAPLRLGFAGGGSDVSPYCDVFGGCVLNATIAMFAHASIAPREDGQVGFFAVDRDEAFEGSPSDAMEREGILKLHRAVYRRIVTEFLDGEPISINVTTHCDAPAGSGLGSSSTLVVAMLEAYRELLALPLGEYDVARLAYDIERIDVGEKGGRQDQYAAAFGGFNFIEFGAGDNVIVNPLRVRSAIRHELEAMIVLHFTGVSRSSSSIIQEQSNALNAEDGVSLNALHDLKNDAIAMKKALLSNDISSFCSILKSGWEAKKKTSSAVSTPQIDALFDEALRLGAKAGKVSGAGGGGFVMFLVDPDQRPHFIKNLKGSGGWTSTCTFEETGAQAWRLPLAAR